MAGVEDGPGDVVRSAEIALSVDGIVGHLARDGEVVQRPREIRVEGPEVGRLQRGGLAQVALGGCVLARCGSLFGRTQERLQIRHG
jgi:hypothetical protein